ncbi:hypothetical protein ACIRSS_48655 [Amycolatopsis sp. NPDC101161]|uniref:hypothetical protein n=1 Tax=Amycolatopsis sp. NPDC101161 TaxID=3363940 RepID=UPI0037FCE791
MGWVDLDESGAGERRPPILSTFAFYEGRAHARHLADRRRDPGGRPAEGIARVYDHVTPAMVNQIPDALEERRLRSLASL